MIKTAGPSKFLFFLLDFLFRHKRIFAVLLITGFIALGFSVNHRSKRVPPRTDFKVFIQAAETLRDGKSIYQMETSRSWRYVYFPLLAVLLVPFTHLPFLVNAALWYALSVAAFLGTFLLSVRLFPNPRDGLLPAGAALVLCLPVILDSFTRGQLGILQMFFAVAVFYLYVNEKKFWAGFLLAFAVTLKFSPLLILGVYFVFNRQWRVCFGAAAGFLVFIVIFPSAAIGIDHNISLLREYRAVVYNGVTDTNHEELLWKQLVTPFAGDNQSLYAVLTRLYWKTEALMKGQRNILIHAVIVLFEIASLLALFIFSRAKAFFQSFDKRILEFGFYPVVMLLAAPVAEMHHYTVLFLLFLPAFIQLQNPALSRAHAFWLEACVWITSASFLFGYLLDPIGDYGLPVWSVMALCLALIWPLSRSKTA